MEAVGRRRRGAARGPPRKAARRGASPDYWLHTTEDDVLLIVAGAGAGPRRAGRRRRRAPGRRRAGESRAEEGAAGPAPQSAWGERVPPEILERVFRVSVAWEGAVPFLCRVARVCRLWYRAAASPTLWQQVSVGFCWVEPGKKQPPATEKRILGTVEWLAASRFSLLRDFTLCHWKSHVPFVLKALGESCPLLASLKLSHCSGVQAESLSLLAKRCPRLESLDLQHSQVDSSAVLSFLEVTGSRLKRLWLTYSSRINAILTMLAAGSCPGLQLLEVNRDIKQSSQRFQLPVEQLQAASPDLQVLRLLNVIWSPKPSLRTAPAALGFPQLEELCLATTVLSFVTDSVLRQLLWASARLRMLDLRGCFRVTPKGLQELPCPGELHVARLGPGWEHRMVPKSPMLLRPLCTVHHPGCSCISGCVGVASQASHLSTPSGAWGKALVCAALQPGGDAETGDKQDNTEVERLWSSSSSTAEELLQGPAVWGLAWGARGWQRQKG